MSTRRIVGFLGVALVVTLGAWRSGATATGVSTAQAQDTSATSDTARADLEGLTIARLEFTGNRRVRDRTLYQIFRIETGAVYSEQAITEGIGRLNRFGKLVPLTTRDVVVTADRDRATVDLEVRVQER